MTPVQRRIGHLVALAILIQGSCAEIPTAPRAELMLNGTVLDRDGGAISYAEVVFRRNPPSAKLTLRAMTGSDGAFALALVSGRYSVDILLPFMAGLTDARGVAVDIAGPLPRFDYRFGGQKIEGVVTGPDSAPVTNAIVSFFGIEAGSDRYVELDTRFDGTTFRGFLPPGSYTATVSPPSIVEGIPRLQFSNLTVTSDTTFTFALTGHRIYGCVIGPDGLPMSDVTLYYQSSEATGGFNSGADGSYEVFVPSGFYRQRVWPGLDDRHVMDRTLGYVNVTGERSLDLDLSGTWWSGTVLDAPGGRAVPSARVSVHNMIISGNAVAVCDANGAFQVSVPKGAWHKISVTAPDREGSSVSPVAAGADSTLELYAGPIATMAPTSNARGDMPQAIRALTSRRQ